MCKLLNAIAFPLLGLLLSTTPVLSQTATIEKGSTKKVEAGAPKEEKKAKAESPSLAQMLEQALKHNPDIQAADAKVRDAEAELNRVRLKALSKIAALHAEIAALRENARVAQEQLQSMSAQYKAGQANLAELGAPTIAVQKAKADLARAAAEMPYLLGARLGLGPNGIGPYFPGIGAKEEVRLHRSAVHPANKGALVPMILPGLSWKRTPLAIAPEQTVHSLPRTLAENLRIVLDEEIDVNLSDVTIKQIAELLTKKFSRSITISLRLEDNRDAKNDSPFKGRITVGAVFQWIEDEYDGVKCVVRDYGIMIADENLVPPGAIPLLEFWRNPSKFEAAR
jgi:hypothetical protein